MTITTVTRAGHRRATSSGNGWDVAARERPASDTIRQATTRQTIAGIPIGDEDWRLRVPNNESRECVWPDSWTWREDMPEATVLERKWIDFITVWKDMKNKGRWPSNIQMLSLARCFLRHEGMKDEEADSTLSDLIVGETNTIGNGA